jgi:biopolymer transport protein ExbD
MAAKVSSGGGSISDPNVIPFIDILLVLLIIFMVTAPIPTVDIKVDLPPPVIRQTPPEEGKKPTNVVLREYNGLRITVDGFPVQRGDLASVVYDRAKNVNAWAVENVYRDARIMVRADQNTAYGNVIDIMGALQEAGFNKVGIFSERANEG